MNKNENAGGFLCTDEERLLISRATELSERCEKNAVALSFLTPREQRLVFSAMEREGCADRVFFWGGYFGAERRKAIFLPSWLDFGRCRCPLYSKEREEHFVTSLSEMGMESILSDYIGTVKLSGSGYAKLSHRDFLGALMALGLQYGDENNRQCDRSKVFLKAFEQQFGSLLCRELLAKHQKKMCPTLIEYCANYLEEEFK